MRKTGRPPPPTLSFLCLVGGLARGEGCTPVLHSHAFASGKNLWIPGNRFPFLGVNIPKLGKAYHEPFIVLSLLSVAPDVWERGRDSLKHTHRHVHIHTRAHAQTYVNTCMHAHAHTHAYLYVDTHVHEYTLVCAHRHIHAHVHTWTQTPMHMKTCART